MRKELIKQISNLYSILDRLNETARRIDNHIYDVGSFPSYLRSLTYCWKTAINLDMRLQEHTKSIKNLDWQAVLSKKDDDIQNHHLLVKYHDIVPAKNKSFKGKATRELFGRNSDSNSVGKLLSNRSWL